MRLSRFYLWAIAISVAMGLALLVNQWLGVLFFRDVGPWLGVLALSLGYAVVGLGCATACEKGKAPRLMRSGMIVGAIALAAWIAVAFVRELQVTFGPYRACVWLTIWPCLMAGSGMLLLLPMHDGWRWGLRAATLIMLTLLAVFIAGAFAFYPDWDSSYDYWESRWQYERAAYQIGTMMGMLTAGALLTTLIVGVAGALTGRAAPAATLMRLPYWLQCPRCGTEQNATMGDHFCVACNLRTKMEFV